MKKMITLFAAVMLVASSFAQYHDADQRDHDKNRGNDEAYNGREYRNNDDRNDNRHADGRYAYGNRERDLQAAQINREYDRKISAVQRNWFMGRSKKESIIRSLQNQRRDEIRLLFEKFNRNNRRYDDRDQKHNW